MVPVIALSQLFTKFIIRYSARSSKFMKLCFQIVVDFTLANATDFDILIPHGYIVQVVQVTKHTDFAKLCHTGKECKLDATVHCFKRSIKGFNVFRNCFCNSSLPMACNMGLSYSSTRITTRCPANLQARSMIPAKRKENERSDGSAPYSFPMLSAIYQVYYPDFRMYHISRY